MGSWNGMLSVYTILNSTTMESNMSVPVSPACQGHIQRRGETVYLAEAQKGG